MADPGFAFVFTHDELAQLQAMLMDWLQDNAPEGVTPLVQAVCNKLGVSTAPDMTQILLAQQPMRPNLG